MPLLYVTEINSTATRRGLMTSTSTKRFADAEPKDGRQMSTEIFFTRGEEVSSLCFVAPNLAKEAGPQTS